MRNDAKLLLRCPRSVCLSSGGSEAPADEGGAAAAGAVGRRLYYELINRCGNSPPLPIVPADEMNDYCFRRRCHKSSVYTLKHVRSDFSDLLCRA